MDELELTGWGLLVQAPIQHTLSCSFVSLPDGGEWRAEDADCTCGYEWRIRLSTYMALYNAWRKRAEEAELELLRLRRVVVGLDAAGEPIYATRPGPSGRPSCVWEWVDQ